MVDDPERAGRKKAMIKQKATSCDLCTHLKEPSCVYACPHDAAHRVDPRTFFADMLGHGSTKCEWIERSTAGPSQHWQSSRFPRSFTFSICSNHPKVREAAAPSPSRS